MEADLSRANAWVTEFGLRPGQWEQDRSAAAVTLVVPVLGASRPQPSAVAPLPSGGLPVKEFPVGRPHSAQAALWWAGCHGGAGVTTLIAVTGGGRDSGRHWPVLASGAESKVVLVARTHGGGLRAAQTAARQWASGSLSAQIELLGLVLVADAPGRLPRPLRDFARLVAGGVPRTWDIEWHEELRLGSQRLPADASASDYNSLASALTTIITGDFHA